MANNDSSTPVRQSTSTRRGGRWLKRSVSRRDNLLFFQERVNWASFLDLSQHLHYMRRCCYEQVVFDFSAVNSAFPNGMVPIVALTEKLWQEGIRVTIVPPTESNASNLFMKSGWLHYLSPSIYPASEPSPYRRYGLHKFTNDRELNDIISYLVTVLLQTATLATGIPQAFEWIANELAGNVLVHAETGHGWIQMGIYPEHQRLSLVVCDGGIGIPASMRRAFKLRNDLEALELAVRGQVTSKPEFGQGNGLAGSIAITLFGNGQFCLTSGDARLVVQKTKLYRGSGFRHSKGQQSTCN